jgi:hypothetical protein
MVDYRSGQYDIRQRGEVAGERPAIVGIPAFVK